MSPGRVDAVEAGGAEILDLRVLGLDRLLQGVERLVDDLVGADLAGHGGLVGVLGDELGLRLHVDAVDAGVAQGRRVGGEIDLLRPALADHLDDRLGRVAPDDAVVDEEDLLPADLRGDGVELLADGVLPLVGGRHDEGPADVAVLDQGLAVLQVELAGDLDRRVAGRVGDGDDDVDRELAPADLPGQGPAEVDPALVDVGLVDERVGPGEVDPFEEAGRQGRPGGCASGGGSGSCR